MLVFNNKVWFGVTMIGTLPLVLVLFPCVLTVCPKKKILKQLLLHVAILRWVSHGFCCTA
jgi:hypothetical protein